MEETFYKWPDVTGIRGRIMLEYLVSEITETLWEEYEAFTRRGLSGFDVAYIFLDAVFEPMRMFKGPKEGILCA